MNSQITSHSKWTARKDALPFNSVVRAQKMKYALFASMVFIITGCVPYPIYKTLQPEAFVEVKDAKGNPLENAEVILIASAYPYGFEKTREIIKTDEEGMVNFNSVKEWRTEVIMIHGAETYFWNWCVSKDGYETFKTNNTSGDQFKGNIIIMLKQGDSSECSAKTQ